MKTYSDDLPNINKETVTRTLDESVKTRELVERNIADVADVRNYVTEVYEDIGERLQQSFDAIDSVKSKETWCIILIAVNVLLSIGLITLQLI